MSPSPLSHPACLCSPRAPQPPLLLWPLRGLALSLCLCPPCASTRTLAARCTRTHRPSPPTVAGLHWGARERLTTAAVTATRGIPQTTPHHTTPHTAAFPPRRRKRAPNCGQSPWTLTPAARLLPWPRCLVPALLRRREPCPPHCQGHPRPAAGQAPGLPDLALGPVTPSPRWATRDRPDSSSLLNLHYLLSSVFVAQLFISRKVTFLFLPTPGQKSFSYFQ